MPKFLTSIGSFFGVNKFALIAVAAAFAAGGFLGWHEKALRVPALLTAQQESDAKACKTEQDITKGKNDELVKNRDRIAADLERYKRLHPDTCLYLTGTGELQPGAGEHAGMHGIHTDQLRDYAALCEQYRSELMVCSGQRGPK